MGLTVTVLFFDPDTRRWHWKGWESGRVWIPSPRVHKREPWSKCIHGGKILFSRSEL